MICPQCSQPHVPGHAAGSLVFLHANDCALREADDATVAADHERFNTFVLPEDSTWIAGGFVRPMTPTERTLLGALGHDLATLEPTTTVLAVTPSITRREWTEAPALAAQGPQ